MVALSAVILAQQVLGALAAPAVSSGLPSSASAAVASATPAAAYIPPPPGGQGTSPKDIPVYQAADPFDAQSLQLANMQEFIELDLFHYGLARFNESDFDEAGIDASQRYLIQVWAEQEVGHSIALNNMLTKWGTVEMCNYTYPFDDVRGFIDFNQVLTRWGEAGVYGFLPHLTSRPAAQILLQSITTEAKQQEGFTMMEGLFPTPYWFNMGLPQSYAWSFLVRYVTSCPPSNPRINFNIFPFLTIENNKVAALLEGSRSAVSTNKTSQWSPGAEIQLSWEPTNVTVGPPEQGRYYTASNSAAGPPAFAAFIHQLNVTYVPLENVSIENRTATTRFPDFRMYNETHGFNVNGTVFVSLVDKDVDLTPFNLSLINDHTLAVGWLHAW